MGTAVRLVITGTGGGSTWTVTIADANFVGSALLVAVTVSVPALAGEV